MLIGVAVVAVLAIPVLSMQLGLPSGASQPTSTTERQAYDLVSEHFGPGFNGALLAVANPVTSEQEVAAITARLAKVPGVLVAKPASLPGLAPPSSRSSRKPARPTPPPPTW